MLRNRDEPKQVPSKKVRLDSLKYVKSTHSSKEKQITLDLVKESFGDVDEAYEDYYNWTYLQNPLGTGTVLFVYDQDKPVAQLGSIPCSYWFMNKCVPVTLAIDVCVTPEYRGNGILVELMRRIHAFNDSVPFSLSVPSAPSIGGHIRSDYKLLPMSVLVRPLMISSYFRNIGIKTVLKPIDRLLKKNGDVRVREHVDRFDGTFDDLAIATCAPNTIRQMRSSQFLNWRYKDNPRRRYKVFAAARDGILYGYIITRLIKFENREIGYIVDFVARENAAGKSLVSAALQDFWENNVVYSRAACFPNCLEYDLLRETGFFPLPSRVRSQPSTLCVKIFNDNLYQGGILDTNKWFFMLGDNDSH